MRNRLRAAVVPLALVVVLGAAVGAPAASRRAAAPSHAASPSVSTQGVSSFRHIAVTGRSASGQAFTGTLSIRRFVVRRTHGHRAVYALGTLRGELGTRTIHRRNVLVPVRLGSGAAAGGAGAAQAGCPILHLTLGPLDLNLLGLKVHLNRVVLDITAQPGAGNLLGNLLCDIANLLNHNPVTGHTLADLLNTIADILRRL